MTAHLSRLLSPRTFLMQQEASRCNLIRKLMFTIVTSLAVLMFATSAAAQFANGTGIAIIPGSALGWALALQSDGKIVAAGPCGTTYCVARLNADGTADTSFGNVSTPGRVVIPDLIYMFGRGKAKLLVRADGKIVFAASCRAGPSLSERTRFCVARLNANGTLDETFTGPSLAVPGNGRFVLPVSVDSDDIVMGMAVESINQQKLILVGECNRYHCVARLNDDGAFDATFTGPGSSVSVPGIDPPAPSAGRDVFKHLFNDFGRANSVTTYPNGKILIVGVCEYFATRICLTKLNADGSLDTDFNGDNTPPGQNPGRIVVTSTTPGNAVINESGLDVALQSNGDFLVLCEHGLSAAHCIYRFNNGGTLDTNFSSGLAFPSVPGRTVFSTIGRPVAIALTPPGSGLNNRVLSLGNCNQPSNTVTMCVGALNNQSGGAFDGTVDSAGLTGPNGDGAGSFAYPAWPSGGVISGVGPNAIVAKSDGSFFIVSTCSGQMCVYKFRPDGALDTSRCNKDVDSDGFVSAPADGMRLIRALLAVPGAPVLPAGLGYDIDGDGELNAARDGLLFARRMLGFSGSALTSGITAAPNARRSSGVDIESYLRTRCGLS